ncbi:S-adenosyl-L-methionine-dependent methyltransferase [Stipitochalara longipes BDJ]|nr:S-adenosyl-L-methionine-dependent methyltransferase [Stipitochalara longipes BDJ]
MKDSRDPNPEVFHHIEEIPERLDEQHDITTQILGFLIHPTISINLSRQRGPLRIADIGTGTGSWLIDVARTFPSAELIGFDISTSAFPHPSTLPPNISFRTQDMLSPFPSSEIGTYDLIAVRFISMATTRSEWISTIQNLLTLLKPGGWLQWIDSCNFSLYCDTPGSSRKACQEIYDGLESFREKEDLVIGMGMQARGNVGREEVWRGIGLVDVHEDVFSTDRVQDAGLGFREKGTRNAMACFVGVLEGLVNEGKGEGWSRERIERVRIEAEREIDADVYHTLDHVCIVGRKPDN